MIRIAYCIEGFHNHGGMERVLSVKVNWLAEHGFDVTIIVARQENKPFAYQIDERIRFVDLMAECKCFVESYQERLQEFLMENHHDIVISMGGLDVRFLPNIHDGSKKIVELHFAWDRFVSSGQNLYSKLKGFVQTLRYLCYLKNFKNIVVLTKHDKKTYARLGMKTVNIYNPITISSAGKSDLVNKRIISVGRLDYQKGFDFLIKAWELVEQRHGDWHLDIFGDGSEKEKLQALIDSKKLKNISLCGSSTELNREYLNSSIYVMSSRYEGLGLVLIEAATHGLPLVAFDCPAGPNEIVTNDKNGYLVRPVGNIKELANKICLLIENYNLRCSMGVNAFDDSKRFNVDNIMQQWVSLFDIAK